MYKRTPAAIQQGSPELQAAFALLQRLWVKDFQHVWTALQVWARLGWNNLLPCPAAAAGAAPATALAPASHHDPLRSSLQTPPLLPLPLLAVCLGAADAGAGGCHQ